MSTEPIRIALHGPTMGTRWSASFFAPADLDVSPLRQALQIAVDQVDSQMSTWRHDSDLMRLNAAPIGEWVSVPAQLADVLCLALKIGRISGGAFDIGMGDVVTAWGFGSAPAEPERIRAAMSVKRTPAYSAVEVKGQHVRKSAAITLDLNGIAKGYGVDQLAETLREYGITDALVGIDGEMRALGLRPDQEAWTIAVEAPDIEQRRPYSILALHDAAVATSGDYRHWIDVQDRRLSHTMSPTRGAPLMTSPASVTVIAPTCAEADAWATAFMVLGTKEGANLAAAQGLDALFLIRNSNGSIKDIGVGGLFCG